MAFTLLPLKAVHLCLFLRQQPKPKLSLTRSSLRLLPLWDERFDPRESFTQKVLKGADLQSPSEEKVFDPYN